jgi:hypothetical protein
LALHLHSVVHLLYVGIVLQVRQAGHVDPLLLVALRLRLVATKDRPCTDFPDKDEAGAYPAEVILDFDYWAAVPKRG